MIDKIQYRGLAFDLDGTLLDENSELTPAVVALLAAAQQRGIKVFLASGRMSVSMARFGRQLNLTTPLTAYNGARVLRSGEEPIFAKSLPKFLNQEIVAFARSRGLILQLYYDDLVCPLDDTPQSRAYAEFLEVPCVPLTDGIVPDAESAKALIIAPHPDTVPAILRAVKGRFEQNAEVTTSSTVYIEISPLAVNKAAGLRAAVEAEGLSLAEIIAVGDGMNDREMLEQCALGFAVDDGDAELKKIISRHIPRMSNGGLEMLLSNYFGFQL